MAVDKCLGSARNALGPNYVDTFYTAFNTRCEQGISTASDTTYGMEAPVSTEFPESTGSSIFTFDAQRIVYYNTRTYTKKSENEYATVTSNSSKVMFGENNWSNTPVTVNCNAGPTQTGSWYTGDKMKVTVSADFFGNGSGDDSGVFEGHAPYTSCYKGKSDRCKDNSLYFKVYEITNILHGTPSVEYGGRDVSGTSSSNPIVIGNGYITFTHKLRRSDSWTKPANPYLNDVYKRKISSDSAIYSQDYSWQGITLNASGSYTSVTDSIDASSLGLEPNVPKQICSTVTYRKVKSLSYSHIAYNDNENNTDSSVICVWVKDDRMFLQPGSRSSVLNSIDSKTVTHEEGSGTLSSTGSSHGTTQKFVFSFVHELKLQGPSGNAYDIDYYVERSLDGGSSYSPVANGGSAASPLRANIPTNLNSAHQNRDNYYEVMTNSWTSSDIPTGDSTPIVCERITFRPKNIERKTSTGLDTVRDNSWQSSTVCTQVTRSKPKEAEISATCKVIVDGKENPTEVIVGTGSNFQFQFGFNLSTSSGKSLDTTYTIKRTVNNDPPTIVKTASVTAPVNGITDSPLIPVDEGSSAKVCETINLNPYKYSIHIDGNGNEENTPEAQVGNKDAATCCATVARPEKSYRDDGEITVYSESAGSLDDPNQTGGFDNAADAWIIKTASATITYTHKLWRVAEKHTGDGVHQADVTSPAEDVTVRYRFADPSATFAATSITTAHTQTVATNTKDSPYSLASNRSDPLLNANTLATASVVGVKNEYCQSIYYVSEKYTLRGLYWMVDGQIYANDPGIQGVQPPVSKEIVGQSAKGCVNVIRPYNFNIDSITATGSSKPVNTGQSVEAKFSINVIKNDPDYMLTDVPNSDVKLVSFVINATPANGALSGSANVSGSPCSYFSGRLGGTMDDGSCSDSASNGPLPSHNSNSYYTDNSYSISNYAYASIMPNLPITKKYCLAIAIQPTSSNINGGYGFLDTLNTNYTVSDATCFNVGKYPSMQIWGGSTFTSGGTDTSTTTVSASGSSAVFGSWDDYMIIAKGTVNNTASGAALISGLANFSERNISPLTVANSNYDGTDPTKPKLGGSNLEVVERMMSGIKTRYIDGNGEYAELTEMSGDSHLVNQQVLSTALTYYPILLYNSDSDHKNIYISSNIETGITTRTYKSFAVPQVIIYTPGDIYIDPSVTRIEAWLLAGGVIKTCADNAGINIRLTDSDRCGSRLTVVGPTVARKIYFDRTYGGDGYRDESGNSTIKEPAEIFDLNPGAYLFGANEARDNAQPITTYLQELPPRY